MTTTKITNEAPSRPTSGSPPMPAPVRAALEYLSYARLATVTGLIRTPTGTQVTQSRELDIDELRTRQAALEVIRGYLSAASKFMAQGAPAPVGNPSEN